MHPDLQALLAVQADDDVIQGLERQLGALTPRLLDLDRARQLLADALDRARSTAEATEKKHRELAARVADHKQKQERNVAQLDQVRKLREATAAMSQVEQARRVLLDEEGELDSLGRRVNDLRQAVTLQEQALADAERDQQTERGTIGEERERLERELRAAQAERQAKAARVSKGLLAKYDRIRSRRRSTAVFALNGLSCGNCDTAIPLQRRNVMTTSGAIEVCEACGVLLYTAS